LRDPHVRKLGVWLPPQYDEGGSALPVLYDLVGFTGSGLAHATGGLSRQRPERAARLIREGKWDRRFRLAGLLTAPAKPVVNSSAIGDYADI